jgi:hypothetical protein
MDVFRRDRFHCVGCGQNFLVNIDNLIGATLDHLVPRCHKGSKARENLISLCYPCNQLKRNLMATTAEEAREVIQRERARLDRVFRAWLQDELDNAFSPTPLEIQLGMEEVRDGWDAHTEQNRRVHHPLPWMPPKCRRAEEKHGKLSSLRQRCPR